MGKFQSKLGGLGIAVAAAALCSAWAGEAEAQTPQLLRLSQLGLSECNRDLASNPRVSTNAAFPSAREIIAAAYRRAAENGGVQLDGATLDAVERATNECVGGLQANSRYVADAYSCAAEGNFLLAQHQRQSDTNYRQAACRFATLALVTRRSNAERSAAAERRLGDTIWARSSDTTNVDLAITAYRASAGVHQTHAAYEALGRAYSARGDQSAADGAYDQLLRLRPAEFTGAPRAAALAARARLPNKTPSQAEALWREAYGISQTGEAAVELGKFEMASAPTQASNHFQFAAGRAWPISATGVNYQLEASYFWSLMESPAWSEAAAPLRSQWTEAERLAGIAGTSQPRYRRQACLSHIGLGGNDYSSRHLTARNTAAEFAADRAHDENEGRVCTGGAGDAEGQLLAGMYWLRRAQYNLRIDNDAWRGFLLNAERAFRDAGQAATGANNVELPWLDKRGQFITIGGARPRIADVITSGAAVTNHMQRLCAGDPPTNSQLYDYYDVRACYPRGQ